MYIQLIHRINQRKQIKTVESPLNLQGVRPVLVSQKYLTLKIYSGGKEKDSISISAV